MASKAQSADSYDFFISFAKEDVDTVRKIVEVMENIYRILREKADILCDTKVENFRKEGDLFCLETTAGQFRSDYLIAAPGRAGAEWFTEQGRKLGLSFTNNAVDVCVRVMPDKVNVRLRDNGAEFDPTDYIDNSGRHITGLELVRMLSSSINYNRILGFNVTNVAISYE